MLWLSAVENDEKGKKREENDGKEKMRRQNDEVREPRFTKNSGHKMEIRGVRNIYYLTFEWRKKKRWGRGSEEEKEQKLMA